MLPNLRQMEKNLSDSHRLGNFLDTFFEGFPAATRSQAALPAVDIELDEEIAVVTADLPGFDPEGIDISVHGERVTIAAQRRFEREETKDVAEAAETPGNGETPRRRVVRRERYAGAYKREFVLPFRVDADAVKANYENGVLTVELPRTVEDRPKRIEIGRG